MTRNMIIVKSLGCMNWILQRHFQNLKCRKYQKARNRNWLPCRYLVYVFFSEIEIEMWCVWFSWMLQIHFVAHKNCKLNIFRFRSVPNHLWHYKLKVCSKSVRPHLQVSLAEAHTIEAHEDVMKWKLFLLSHNGSVLRSFYVSSLSA